MWKEELNKINIEVSTLTTQISENEQKLSNAQEKYDKLETMYYKKFTAMETAMNKMNSQSSLFSSL